MYAIAAIQIASHTASRSRACTTRRSAASSVSGSPHAWMPCRCAMRVNVWVLNANIDPASRPAARSPVHSYTRTYPAYAVSAKPSIRRMLNTSTGDAPSHASGAPMSAGTMSGSEYASVSRSG